MIWKESYNLKHKNGIEITLIYRMILIRLKSMEGKFERNKPKLQDGRLKIFFFHAL